LGKGEGNKAPGSDGICLEFYKVIWETTKDDILAIINQMFIERKVTDQQKHRLIVFLPKSNGPTTPADFRPIILLNNDYKLVARIIANRIRPMLTELLQPSQYCGMPGNTIFEAETTVREAIAHVEVKRAPLCLLSLDFRKAFDRISHTYLFTILRSYGFSDRFIDRIKCMYENA